MASTPTRDVAQVTSALLLASRALIAIASRSLDDLENRVTLEQHRALVVLATRGPRNLTTLAEEVGLRPSTATRLVDGLVELAFVERERSPVSGREVVIELSREGRRVVDKVMARRRDAVERVVEAMTPEQRRGVVDALTVFADVSGEPPEQSWALGWGSEPTTP